MIKAPKYISEDFDNFSDESINKNSQRSSKPADRTEQRQDKTNPQRKNSIRFVVAWQLYEADPYDDQSI